MVCFLGVVLRNVKPVLTILIALTLHFLAYLSDRYKSFGYVLHPRANNKSLEHRRFFLGLPSASELYVTRQTT